MLSSFSSGYTLCETVDVRRWPQDEAVMPRDLYMTLAEAIGEPVIGYTGGVHYQFRPEHGVPALTAVVPERNHDQKPRAFLLQY